MKMIEQATKTIDSIKANITIEEKYKNNTIKLIKEKYPEIEKAMKKEKYIIEYQEFDNFNEIIKDDKIIGFFTTQTRIDNQINIILNECYIIPEKRGQDILKDIIFSIKTYPDMDIILRNPTRQLIKTLEHSGLAIPLEDGITYTIIKLIDSTENIRYTQDKTLTKKAEYTTKLYDQNNSTMITINENKITVNKPRKSEKEKYNIEQHEIKKGYLNNIKIINLEYKQHMDTLELLYYSKQLEYMTVDNYIGTEKELLPKTIEQLEKHQKTIKEGQKIRQKIQEALEENDITQETIYNRFMYLLEDEEKEEKTEHTYTCPECNKKYNPQFKYCHNCGYNIYRLNMKEELMKLVDEYNPLNIYDELTGLEVKFQRKILKEGYDVDEIYEDQLEIATCQLLEYIDNNPEYTTLVPFDIIHHIRPEDTVNYLLKHKLIEEKDNPNYNKDNSSQTIDEELDDINITDPYIYKIKRKGRIYYKINKIAKIYTENLIGLDYYDFKRYILNSHTYDKELIINEYTTHKLRQAIKYEDYQLYTTLVTLEAQRLIEINQDIFATTLIKAIICSLNTYALKSKVTTKDMPIQVEIIAVYTELKDIISQYNIDELIDKAYNTIQLKNLKINKRQNKKTIKKLLKEDAININEEIILEKIGVEE